MSFLGNLVGRAEHTIQNVEHAAGNAINNAVHGGQPAPASTAKPIIDYAPRMQPIQAQPLPHVQAQPMPMLNAQGQPQYNPSMGGAPIQAPQQIPLAQQIPHLAQQIPSDQNASDQIWNAIGGLRYDPAVFGEPADNTVRSILNR